MVKRQALAVQVDLTRARCVDDLKRLGSFREVKALFQARLGPGVRVKVRSWQGLLDAVRRAVEGCTVSAPHDAIFVSEATEAIFALLRLHGDVQFELLGIEVRHFGDRSMARVWRDRLARLVHPDRCDHPAAGRAMAEVSEIYETMCEGAR